jgi:hypothetical protein
MANLDNIKNSYGLTIEALGRSPIVEITMNEFYMGRNSMRLLVDTLGAEEKLESRS